MHRVLGNTIRSFFLSKGHVLDNKVRLALLTLTLLTSPTFARAENRICTTTNVIYEDKQAIQTECNNLYSTESRLTKGINKRSLSFNESVDVVQKLGNFFDFMLKRQEKGTKNYIKGFPDQRISYEGAELERIYNIMLSKQYEVEPMRTTTDASPFDNSTQR